MTGWTGRAHLPEGKVREIRDRGPDRLSHMVVGSIGEDGLGIVFVRRIKGRIARGLFAVTQIPFLYQNVDFEL